MTTQLLPTPAQAPRTCDNATLLARMADGDQSAWRQLVAEYDRLVRSVAASFRLQTADVHDVVQTTWLRLLQHVHTIRDPERLAGWLAVTATHESLAVLRRSSRVLPLPTVDETPDATADPAREVADRDEARDLWAAVAELPPRQQRLLVALFREELDSYDEVAATCAMPIGSIGPTRGRALARLRVRLADRGLGPAA
ncbi:RNA polymerase sigma factor [Geodermatophilus sp. URMC 62]|uniref:RNA polymerase sigma factor n=1 Tax=Geodermatophilus sp. URMC 62 TaxID=3423414 RepID=UPI00406D1792